MNLLAEMISARLSSVLWTPQRLWPPRSGADLVRLLSLYDSPELDRRNRPGIRCYRHSHYTDGWGTLCGISLSFGWDDPPFWGRVEVRHVERYRSAYPERDVGKPWHQSDLVLLDDGTALWPADDPEWRTESIDIWPPPGECLPGDDYWQELAIKQGRAYLHEGCGGRFFIVGGEDHPYPSASPAEMCGKCGAHRPRIGLVRSAPVRDRSVAPGSSRSYAPPASRSTN